MLAAGAPHRSFDSSNPALFAALALTSKRGPTSK
jgi:hypothetical protein